jgi:hypothetical protein
MSLSDIQNFIILTTFHSVDFRSTDGKTWQVGALGMFERYLETDQEHPTRRNVQWDEMKNALGIAEGFRPLKMSQTYDDVPEMSLVEFDQLVQASL